MLQVERSIHFGTPWFHYNINLFQIIYGWGKLNIMSIISCEGHEIPHKPAKYDICGITMHTIPHSLTTDPPKTNDANDDPTSFVHRRITSQFAMHINKAIPGTYVPNDDPHKQNTLRH